jgi:hypothetical protein
MAVGFLEADFWPRISFGLPVTREGLRAVLRSRLPIASLEALRLGRATILELPQSKSSVILRDILLEVVNSQRSTMAASKDYIGRSFGEFVIEARIGGGAEAEVLQCLHKGTGIRYVLRLSINEDALWTDEPLIPPQNANLESNNARGTWLAAPSYYQASFTKESGDDATWKITNSAIYGIMFQRPLAGFVR